MLFVDFPPITKSVEVEIASFLGWVNELVCVYAFLAKKANFKRFVVGGKMEG